MTVPNLGQAMKGWYRSRTDTPRRFNTPEEWDAYYVPRLAEIDKELGLAQIRNSGPRRVRPIAPES